MNDNEIISVHRHLDELFRQQWRGHEAYHVATEEAHRREHAMMDENLRKALDVLDGRFAAHNEWRQQLTGERADLMARREFDSAIKLVLQRLGTLETNQANMQGRWAAWGAAGVAGLVLLQIFLRFVVGP